MNDAQLFAFEADFVASLRCILMAVRLKLDRSGVKLTLRQWSRFTLDDRRRLLEAPCRTEAQIAAYHDELVRLVAQRANEVARPLADPPAPIWEETAEAPPAVAAYARSMGAAPVQPHQWAALSDLQRFALLKLTRDNHDNVNFLPALREFGLLGAA
jgi:hypothetical protein